MSILFGLSLFLGGVTVGILSLLGWAVWIVLREWR